MAAFTSASSVSSATALSVTVAHAITYITRPLASRYPAPTILKLQMALEANLSAHCSSTWVPNEPLRGSGRRCLTLSPNAVPPRPIYASMRVANVQWSEWITALGGIEFDLFVDPGCVSVRFGNWGSGQVGKLITVWSEELAASQKQKKTFAQELLQADEDSEEELFAAIADEIHNPTWTTPITSRFPNVPSRAQKYLSPASAASAHSRSSSWSSNSSSGFSFASDDSDSSSATSVSSSTTEKSKISRRERARQARVYIDTTKTEVTNYDGGKTTVLTGGVMLGGHSGAPIPVAAPAKASKPSASVAPSWRPIRA
ncbi:hypothetical protein EVG20_g5037 [Dentipellis fragilis]|uniref:Anti-proliferative protein domain-containing protein n=1 Tax=Dentipellis fragilis TaxID=205917 RepID=A0A4Y9YUE8_9AGAM|nr:hypothetical protein EVG20_g5037 [Dentipellis fragilis]